MSPWDDRERVTLVALLQERSQAASWPGIAAEIIEAGSARSVWDAHHEQSLFDTETPAPIAESARQIAGWRVGCAHLPRRVVPGLAAGIDTAAHTAALNAGGRTVAVVGTGINRVYPAANRDLQERIACEGLVLSQFWPDATVTKKSFPLRNATMSGYGRATIVVEAGETSGARIQARVGVEHGRAVILRDRVVRANDWAAALQHRSGVHVVSGVDEVLGVAAALRPDLDDVLSSVLTVER